MFRSMLEACERPLNVAVESASIGPAVEGAHDMRVAQVLFLKCAMHSLTTAPASLCIVVDVRCSARNPMLSMEPAA